ncbi:hypothetical protein [Aquamicrobium sp. LC103]|uniref:hypothetical protein n=1 Tax=Aquamicrobium sp. LC103 TaxID=1120658 RepID=UPI00063E70BB|nr:hypothetical protein [Aquamicrobium sp. LC103]TKT78360.1 acetyl-CoA carboxylase [Aquamicrobium sp. LC103]
MSDVDFSDPATIALLTSALEAAGVDGVEIEQPASGLRILLAKGSRPFVSGGSKPGGRAATMVIRAPMAGRFWVHHPSWPATARNYPRPVTRMDVLGFIRVGPILLPLRTAVSGRVEKCVAEHDAMVGFGDSLFEIEPHS